MFFTDYEFMFAFLPAALVGFRWLSKLGRHSLALSWLFLVSLAFYWALDGWNVLALMFSIGVNLLVLWVGARQGYSRPTETRWLLGLGVSFNVLFLIYFKYAGSFVPSLSSIAVPLGISFFTLQQIAYLVSSFNQRADAPQPLKYFLFNTFFPYVIAGPLVSRKEVAFDPREDGKAWSGLLPGLALFSFGLFKKVVIADSIAPYVATVFNAINRGHDVTQADAWLGATLYTLQMYFDFSGYSDMAIGLALLFGLRLSRNFHSPYKATSIMEFWRRWHMSVTRFFTQHVYMVLAVNCTRVSKARKLPGFSAYLLEVAIPMMVTFLLIGVWHGAGANFILFGLLMGFALSVNHWWAKRLKLEIHPILGWGLTMLVVIVGMVLDRSADIEAAGRLLRSMLGATGAQTELLVGLAPLLWLAALTGVVVGLPNTNEIMGKYPAAIKESWDDRPKWLRLQWAPNSWGLSASAFALSMSIIFIPRASSFLYYRF
jgi:alginate O-acetyltransferase complex protein AlgI